MATKTMSGALPSPASSTTRPAAAASIASIGAPEPMRRSGLPTKTPTASRRLMSCGSKSGAPVLAEGGEIDIAVTRIDRRGDKARLLFENERRRESRERGDADDRHIAGDADRAGRGNADPEPRERARPDRHRNARQGRKAALSVGHDPFDERQQGLGMAALHGNRFGGFRRIGAGLQDASRSGSKRRVDREDFHGCHNGAGGLSAKALRRSCP